MSSATPPQTLADQITGKLTPAQIAVATAQQMNGGDTYAFMEVDVNRPFDANGEALLLIATHGDVMLPLVKWHFYPPGSNSDPGSVVYLKTYASLGGALQFLNHGPYNVGGIKAGSYSIDFSATNGDYEEDINITEKDGKPLQTIMMHRNGKVFSPFDDRQ